MNPFAREVCDRNSVLTGVLHFKEASKPGYLTITRSITITLEYFPNYTNSMHISSSRI